MSNSLYPEKQEKEDAISFFKLLYVNRKLLALVGLLGIAGAVLITFLMPNKYYSYGIVFATNSYQNASILENPQFGFEQDAEQLMQLLESEALRNEIVKEFDLVKYYETDTTNLDWEQILVKQYIEDVNFFRSKYMSIVISANTKDPELSANIVNSIITHVNEFKQDVFKSNKAQDFQYKKTAYETQLLRLDTLTTKIYSLKKPEGAIDLIYNHFLMTSKENAPPETYKYINSIELEQLIREYKFEQYRLETLKDEYVKAEYLINRPTQKNYVIDVAKPQYKRSSPSFTLNCSIGLFSAWIFTIVFLFLSKKWKELMAQVKAA